MSDNFEIINGDCLIHMKQIPDQSIDLVLGDPPFKPMSNDYKQVREENKNNLQTIPTPTNLEYDVWWERICQEIKRILKPSGYFCFKSDPYMAREVYLIMVKYFKFYKSTVWDKGKIGLGRKIRMQHELIEVYSTQDKCAHYWKYKISLKPSKPKYKNLDGEIITNKTKEKKWHGSGKGIAFSSVLKVSVVGNGILGAKKQDHINQTPPELWYKFIDYLCPKEGTVLDPFMGSGSIGLTIQHYNKRGANRQYIGIELIKDFFNIAKNQLFPIGGL